MWRLCTYETLESTNLIVKEHLSQGEPEGCVVVSLKQEGGYGRQGRRWVSPAGGLYLSFGLRPNVSPPELSTLTLVVALAIHDVLSKLGYAANVKWPNDILLGKGKVCGISCEAVAGAICIGIGLNVYKSKDQALISGKYNPAHLCPEVYVGSRRQIEFLETCVAAVLNAFEARYKVWQQEGFAHVASYYQDILAMKGSLVRIVTIANDTTAEGVVVGVDESGRLLLELTSGVEAAADSTKKIIAVSSGEVHLL